MSIKMHNFLFQLSLMTFLKIFHFDRSVKNMPNDASHVMRQRRKLKLLTWTHGLLHCESKSKIKALKIEMAGGK